MDRRHFFKTLLLTPLLSPFVLRSKTLEGGSHLYLITDRPHHYISPILRELERYIPGFSKADFLISSQRLQQKVSPSFTLIDKGKIVDIRSNMLLSLWAQMNKNNQVSSLMTELSLQEKRIPPVQGTHVSLFIDGQKKENLALKSRLVKTYRSSRGTVSVRVDGGKAWVAKSSCVHKICCHSSPISLSGERLICAPNHFLLKIEGAPFVDTVIG